MELQALPLLTAEPSADPEQEQPRITLWSVLANTLGLGLFFVSLLAFFDLLSRIPGV